MQRRWDQIFFFCFFFVLRFFWLNVLTLFVRKSTSCGEYEGCVQVLGACERIVSGGEGYVSRGKGHWWWVRFLDFLFFGLERNPKVWSGSGDGFSATFTVMCKRPEACCLEYEFLWKQNRSKRRRGEGGWERACEKRSEVPIWCLMMVFPFFRFLC